MMEYRSNLSPHLADFLAFKHSMGIKYKTCEHYLWRFDRFNFENGNLPTLTKDVVTRWLMRMAGETESQNRSWIPPIREFGRYLRNIGFKDAYVVDDNFVTRRYYAETYLMANSEIVAFFKECISFVTYSVLKPGMQFVYPAFYMLMYCCGLRTIEARMLKCSDMHLEERYIDIMHAKGYRDRRLYLSDELVDYLAGFEREISLVKPNRQFFFPGGCGDLCSSTAIPTTFAKIWIAAGLPHDGKVIPRPYDFRHHFACANIMKWSLEGKDVNAMLPYLMRYMGHSSLESTYYYIHLIPDFFNRYNMLSKPTENIIPEVENDEA
ncbi:MAG: tyrosine-type recombinase/integrase [Sphaerochaetaceae bacterium]